MKQYEKEVLQAQLDSEKKVLKDLKKHYQEALNSINEKIKLLQADELMQSKVYQIEYQKALKGQIESYLEVLHTKEYDSIEEYLKASYDNGYMGALYSIQQQGIPLILPMDQEQIVKAIQLDSKISEGLYSKLGYNVKELKTKIRAEVSRGISSGLMYSDIARNISNLANMDMNKSMRIARTEGHRVQCQASQDACVKAKDKGADVLKQWDASLDGRTRASHRMVDGELVELDETFSNGLRFPSDPRGKASEVVNCRCALLQRAKWALDEEELETLKERAKELGVYDEKEQTFEEYKKKFLKASEQERNNVQKSFESTGQEKTKKHNSADFLEASLRTKDGGDYGVNWEMVKSKEYTDRFTTITDNQKASLLAAKRSRNALVNRDGKNTEEIYAISLTTGKDISSILDQHIPFGVKKTEKFIKDIDRAEKKGEMILLIHNHPRGITPSIEDLNELLSHRNTSGITVGHNGSIYYYTKPSKTITYFDFAVAFRKKKEYNGIQQYEETMKELAKQFEFEFKIL